MELNISFNLTQLRLTIVVVWNVKKNNKKWWWHVDTTCILIVSHLEWKRNYDKSLFKKQLWCVTKWLVGLFIVNNN